MEMSAEDRSKTGDIKSARDDRAKRRPRPNSEEVELLIEHSKQKSRSQLARCGFYDKPMRLAAKRRKRSKPT